ncbi:hypothetical protein [Bacillus sp. 1P06AnD]|uniref:hypothetical protein n=1 Tax=Bacillus sp. 1P06AnD TaxID=3132208 RepID=UPI0039A23BB1
MDFTIVFHVDYNQQQMEPEQASGNEGMVLWGEVDFMLNGASFFSRYHLSERTEEMGNTILTKEGFTVPILPFVSNLVLNYTFIGTKVLEIGKGIMDKELVIIPQGEHVLIGIKHSSLDTLYWYDGERVTKSTNLPVNSMNIVPAKAFRQGIKKGILSFLHNLENREQTFIEQDKLSSLIEKAEQLQP